MSLKKDIINGIMKSENQGEAVVETLTIFKEKEKIMRLAMAATAGAAVYLIDAYLTDKENNKLISKLIKDYNIKDND